MSWIGWAIPGSGHCSRRRGGGGSSNGRCTDRRDDLRARMTARGPWRFWSSCSGVLLRPRRTITSISSSATIADGFAAASMFGCLYGLAALLAHARGREPRGRLPTFIPSRRHYLWQSVYTLPVSLAWMALLGGFARQLSKRLGGKGTFASDFTMLAFTQSMPMIALFWLPDVVCYLLGIDGPSYERLVVVYGPAAVTWAAVLSTAGISTTERIAWPKSLVVVILSEIASAVASGTAIVIR